MRKPASVVLCASRSASARQRFSRARGCGGYRLVSYASTRYYERSGVDGAAGTRFTCCTSTKVQILTGEAGQTTEAVELKTEYCDVV
jgi:hypothetical protein